MKTVPKPLGKSTASQATYALVTLIVFIAAMLTILLSACSSTSIEEPQSPVSADGDNLVITLSTPETYTFPTSRTDVTDIHAGHELRYTAILYKKSSNTTSGSVVIDEKNMVERKELLSKNGNSITFTGYKEGNFFIVVFADYIDANSEPTNGHYPDKYYDTTTSPYYIKLKSLSDKTQYFNNDNLDFFLSITDSFEKKPNVPYTKPLILKRRVSKVQIIATGGSIDALKDININTCSILQEFAISSETATNVDYKITNPGSIEIANRDSKILFYYYTLSFQNPSGKGLGVTTFKLNHNDGYVFNNETIEISAGKISPKVNTIYNVQGDFLSTSQVPSKVVDIKVTTDENWIESSQDLSD